MKILIADDSAVIRTMVEHNLKNFGNYEIVCSTSNGVKALEGAHQYHPDLIISDYDMPLMNGLELCARIQTELKIPVVIMAEDITIKDQAYAKGARLFIQKPKLSTMTNDFWKDFAAEIEGLHITEVSLSICENKTLSFENPKLLVIGSSTGGPNCIVEVAKGLGNNFPIPVLLVQHIEVGADEKMVNWFNSVCENIEFKLAKDGEKALPGKIYMAPADVHLEIDAVDSDGLPILNLSHAPEERFLRPAVNVLFRSAAKFYKNHLLAVLLTGMGRDGAEGCKTIIENGGYTIVEDKSTCVVFGMPAAAIEEGAAKEVLPRTQIPQRVLNILAGK